MKCLLLPCDNVIFHEGFSLETHHCNYVPRTRNIWNIFFQLVHMANHVRLYYMHFPPVSYCQGSRILRILMQSRWVFTVSTWVFACRFGMLQCMCWHVDYSDCRVLSKHLFWSCSWFLTQCSNIMTPLWF